MALEQSEKTADLYRMVMPDHLCPYGLKAKDLLERRGFIVEDHHLKTPEETEAFKKEHGVDTTPQTFIGEERIGGYDDLREHFGQEVKDQDNEPRRVCRRLFRLSYAASFCSSSIAS